MRRLLIVALAVCCFGGRAWAQKPVSPAPAAMWVELDGTGASVRAIVGAKEKCPVVLDGKRKLKLTEREERPVRRARFR